MAEVKSQLSQFYANKNILITGGAGFIGKLLIEKILRSCPDVKGIYLILRHKKDANPETRLENVLKNPLFDTIRKINPDFHKKLHTISGDMMCHGLALSTVDRKTLIDEIDVVIHAAASVNFKISLREAAIINIRGTKELLDLCEEMKNLCSVMVISTAYSFPWRKVIGEHFMQAPISPETMLNMVDEFSEEALEKMQPHILDRWPNTYTFTKAIMEELVRSRKERLPIGLYRPSIVLPTYKEPLKGWSDNYNGPVGIMIAVGIGLLHVLYVDPKLYQDTVPGDYCANGCLAATYDTYRKHQKTKIPDEVVYNYVASMKRSITYGQYQELTMKNFVPGDRPIWACFVYQIRNPVFFWTLNILLHYIPALFYDIFRMLRLKKPRLLKIYYKIDNIYPIFRYFMDFEWKMINDNVFKLWFSLSDKDKEEFPFAMSEVDWEEYYKTYTIGAKHYILKEKIDKESMDVAWKKVEKLKFYHKIVKSVLQGLVILLVLNFFICLYNKIF